MNKKNFIKGTALPVALFFSAITLVPFWEGQQAIAAVSVCNKMGVSGEQW